MHRLCAGRAGRKLFPPWEMRGGRGGNCASFVCGDEEGWRVRVVKVFLRTETQNRGKTQVVNYHRKLCWGAVIIHFGIFLLQLPIVDGIFIFFSRSQIQSIAAPHRRRYIFFSSIAAPHRRCSQIQSTIPACMRTDAETSRSSPPAVYY